MQYSLFKKFLILLVIISTTLATSLFLFGTPPQTFDKVATVKLYSGDKLVATWEATSVGRVDGNTYVFTMGTKPSPTEVRISGTYSVETIP